MRAYAPRTYTHTYTRFLGELLDRSQSPPFLPPFLRCDRADEEDKRTKKERDREKDPWRVLEPKTRDASEQAETPVTDFKA